MKKISLLFSFLMLTLIGFAQWTNNTSVNTQVSGLNASDQQTAATSDGKTWIAFYSQNATTGNYDMRAQLLDANGNRLFGPDGLLVSNQPSGTATFVFNVCTDIFNNLVIAFQYEVAGTLKAVVTKVNTDGVLPWGEGVVLGEGLAPYPAISKTNEVVVSWNNNSPSTTYIQKITNTGTIAWSSPIVLTVGTSNTTRAQIVCNSNGDFTVVFQRRSFGISTTLYAQRYTDSGLAIWSAPVQISNMNSSGARYYSIIADGNTVYFGYYVASGSRFFAYVQKITSSGTLPWGINGSPVTTYASGADPMPQGTNIALDPAAPYIWSVSTYCNPAQTAYGVYVQKIDTASGTVQLNPVGKEIYPISSNYDTQAGDLLLVNGGPMFMSYDINYKIYATRLNNTGDFVWTGNRVELSSTTAGPGNAKGRFAFSRAAGDQGVAVWHENRGADYLSYAQNIQPNGTLPVTLVQWNAEKKNQTTLLSWTTSCEVNCARFEVERSADGVKYQSIASVGSQSAGGYCSTLNQYDFTDTRPFNINYYRLKQIDNDGAFRYSKVIAVCFGNKETLMVTTQASITSLWLNDPVYFGNKVRLLVTDSKGSAVMSQNYSVAASQNNLSFSTAGWPTGIYYICVSNGKGQRQTIGFMVR